MSTDGYVLPNPINSRANQLYDIVSSATEHLDDENALVVDIGAGYGDLDMLIGSRHKAIVVAIEGDEDVYDKLDERIAGAGLRSRVIPMHKDALAWNIFVEMAQGLRELKVIAICFSVLPYINNWHALLKSMSDVSDEAFIECQYAGDGPGKVRGDEEMKELLSGYWRTVNRVGSTWVKEGQFERTVWRCTNEK